MLSFAQPAQYGVSSGWLGPAITFLPPKQSAGPPPMATSNSAGSAGAAFRYCRLMDVFNTPDLPAPIEELSPQADSRDAIFVAALLEDELQRLLLSSMPTISDILASRLFDEHGPLNSFAARIDVARALDLIDVETYTDLRAIQAIRNIFAHAAGNLNFKSAEIERRGISFRRWRSGCDLRGLFEESASTAMAAMAMKSKP